MVSSSLRVGGVSLLYILPFFFFSSISRMRLPLKSLLLLLSLIILAICQESPPSTLATPSTVTQSRVQSSIPIEADSCPPNTFTCKDGSCIPLDWVGDGEPDCDDHSDEEGQQIIPHPHSSEGGPASIPFNVTENPFENVQTEPLEDCPSSHLERIDACSQPTFDLLSSLQSFDFNTTSILPQSISILSGGCDITREYDICIQGASAKCQPEPSIPQWKASETFFCQLLLPTLSEHSDCFAKKRTPRCIININRATSSMCRLIGSIVSDIECLEKTHQLGCTEDALGMLAPIREEAIQVSKDLSCTLPSLEILTDEQVAARDATSTVKPVKTDIEFNEDGEPMIDEEIEVERNITDRIDEDEDLLQDITTIIPSSNQSIQTDQPLPIQTSPPTTTTVPPPPSTTVVSLSIDIPRPPLGDALRTMQVISRVCSTPYNGSPWIDVHSVLCAHQSIIQSHTECFSKVSQKATCTPENTSNSSCSALESINSFLDCAIVLMNDECDVNAQNVIVDIQEKINDKLIEKRCFDEEGNEGEKKEEEEEEDGTFKLHPKLPSCTDDQENGALACLVELVEVNKQLVQLQQLNFLLEISRENSTVVDSICSLYNRYEECLNVSVFSMKGGIRCSFASPLNSLARIGLSPICSSSTRLLLSSHQDCLQRIALKGKNQCQSALSSLGRTVQAMVQGAHGEALLCKSFYLIRDTFECGRKEVENECDGEALMDLTTLKDEMTSLGMEEGCPNVPPSNLDELLSQPITRQPIVAPRIVRPLPSTPSIPPSSPSSSSSPITTGPHPVPVQPVLPVCDQKQQQRFQECVSPLTEYQPHPLIVIRQPRLIDEACAKFIEFKKCTSDVACRPMWSRGMTAMFQFACEEALDQYKEIRGCIRKLAAEDTVRECVSTFSRGAPQQACLSANTLLSCSLPSITSQCGEKAVDFAKKYITKFAQAIDPRCKIGENIPIGRVIGVGCTMEEDAIIEHCAAPLNDIGLRLDEMFQGGLQSLIKNANSLAPVFAGGCNLTAEFEICAAGVFLSQSPCIVSSCMVKAGEEICNSPDPVTAIDNNLSCVFSQVQEPSFAKCIRSTLSTIKQFSLASFKSMLPKFVDCVGDIVEAKCGKTPIKILRAISSSDICAMTPSSRRVVPIKPVQITHQKPTCDNELKQKYRECGNKFYSKYRMLPIALINNGENMDEFCSTLETMDTCSISSRICASPEELALKDLGRHLCSSRSTFDHHKICLKNAAENAQVRSCLSEFLTVLPDKKCQSLQQATNCMAEQIRSSCGEDALQYSFSSINVYTSSAYNKCQISIPTVSLSTDCTEADLVSYLTCETHIDSFSPRPISIIAQPSSLSSFCSAVETQYRPCIEGMACKFEPVSTATLKLYSALCEEQVTRRDHSKFGNCLAEFTNSTEGRACISPLTSLDLINNENKDKVCSTISSTLLCGARSIESSCGYESLLHIYSLYSDFAAHFDSHCALEVPPETGTTTTTMAPVLVKESMDSTPRKVIDEVEEKDEPLPSTTLSTTQSTPSTTTTEETTTTERSHSRDVRVQSSSSLSMGLSLILLCISRYL